MQLPRMLVGAAFSAAVTLVSVISVSAMPAFAAGPKSQAAAPGYDISYPQCTGALPSKPAFGIVGVSDGLAYGKNTCLASEYRWASQAPGPAFYMNTGNPGTAATRVSWYQQVGPQTCAPGNESGCAYDYGYNGAQQALNYAASQTSPAAARAAGWWLDVETANSWSTDPALNVADIQGSIDFLRTNAAAAKVGIYSTAFQWGQITANQHLDAAILNWIAGASSATAAPTYCAASFTGGPVRLVQYPSGRFDADYACP